jgi:hypothetical protein
MPADISALEGHLYGVPLGGGLFGVCLVARTGRLGTLGYFAPRAFEGLPSIDDAKFPPADAVWVGLFGDLGITKGDWPLIGMVPEWRREKWPLPVFARVSELSGRSFRVSYDDALASQPNVTSATAEEVVALPEDGLAGAGFVEQRLGRLLGVGSS